MLEIPDNAPAELHCWMDEIASDQPLRSDIVVAKGPFALLARGLIAVDPEGTEGEWSITVVNRRLSHAEIRDWLKGNPLGSQIVPTPRLRE